MTFPMKRFDKYLLSNKASIRDALIALEMLSADTKTIFVVNENIVEGSLTDGDIRRHLIKGYTLDDSVSKIMNRRFSFIEDENIDLNAIRTFRSQFIKLLPVLNKKGELTDIYNLQKYNSFLPVDAVLMAGGKGERLRPLTEKKPKPLLKVGEKPIIDYNIDSLLSYGIKHISVTINYLGTQIEKHFENERDGVQINCVKEPEYLGTMGAIKFVPHIHNDSCLVMNSDLFTNIDYEDFYLHFKEHNADMSVAVVPYSITVPYGIFELEGRNIKGLKEKPTYNYYANAGIYLIKKELIELIPDKTFYNATDLVEKLIALNRNVIRFPLTGYWIDIGKPEDYKKAQELIKHL